MGTWLRGLSGYRRYLQQESVFIEMSKEYSGLISRLRLPKIPDPYDDLPRKDVYDRSWKRHRKNQYKIKSVKRARLPKVKIIYDTPWVLRRGYRWFYRYKYGEAGMTRSSGAWLRYRVRERYRRQRADI